MPTLEDVHKEAVKKFGEEPLTNAAGQRHFQERKQEVPALSSAKAEIMFIVETAKEMVSIGMLLQTAFFLSSCRARSRL